MTGAEVVAAVSGLLVGLGTAGLVRRRRRLPWYLHESSVSDWAASPRSNREGTDTPFFGDGQTADAFARHYLRLHDLDARLAGDEEAAFVAYSVQEMLWGLFRLGIEAARSTGRDPLMVAQAYLVGGTARLTWHAARALGIAVREPYGRSLTAEETKALEALATAEEDT